LFLIVWFFKILLLWNRWTFHRCFLLSFGSFGKAVSEEKIFRNRPIRNQNCLWWPCLLMYRDDMSTLYRRPAINADCSFSPDPLTNMAATGDSCFWLADFLDSYPLKPFNQNCLWWPCLLMYRDDMSTLYRRPAINASYQVLVHLAKRFQRRRILKNQTIRNKSRLWRLCL
jgi:hypothetical protein